MEDLMTRHIRTVLALGCAIAMLVGGGAVATAQTSSQIPARVTASLGDGAFNDQTATTVAAIEASDARLAGTWNETKGVSVAQLVDGADGLVATWWHEITIVNDGGSWTGHSEGFGTAPDWDGEIAADGETIFLVGSGGYDGLTATLFSSEGGARAPGALSGGAYEGVIFPAGWDPVGH
jgi:hypothetical protein